MAAGEEALPGDKTIIYIRHGKSAGNAGVRGVVEKGSLVAYRDGGLVAKGEQQIVERVAAMDASLIERIASAQVVLVSPLARAMATAVIALAEAHRRSFEVSGCTRTAWPRVEVVTELREKVKSSSERPGSGEDPLAYISATAQRHGERVFGNEAALQPVAEDICRSYEAIRTATNNWEDEPDDALAYMEIIRSFKERLRDREETTLLLVGHSGWARFAFSAFLPAAREEDARTRRLNLINGAREIRALNNAGVLGAKFGGADGLFQGMFLDLEHPAAPDLPNCDEEDMIGILTSLSEARAAGVVPSDGQFDRIMLLKQAEYTGTWEARLFTFSTSGGQAHLAWASKWGEPREHISIGGQGTKLTRLWDLTFAISETCGHRPFKARARTPEDAARFLKLFEYYSQIGVAQRCCGANQSRPSIGEAT
mmetsp:Transcript_72924/g.226613  ORF Transcript_72924/g.226613 Transcript_72924/m.226613 type:complete len:426 (-) Transcript_72924:68-1345(-)